MTWILDASIALAWCFTDQKTPRTEALAIRAAAEPPTVPQLWPLEVANALHTTSRLGRLTSAQRTTFLQTLQDLTIHIDPLTSALAFTDILALADRHNLTTYDAAYLELARRFRAPLATNDRALHAAAKRERLALL